MFCTECAKSIEPHWRHCPSCGAPNPLFEDSQRGDLHAPASTNRERIGTASKAWPLAIIALCVIGVAVLVVMALWRRPHQKALTVPNTEPVVKAATAHVARAVGRKAPIAPAPAKPTVLSPDQIFAQEKGAVALIKTSIQGRPLAAGSGFNISPKGEVITNYHVIRGADAASVYLDGAVFTVAGVIGYNRQTDIAVLGLAGASGLPTVTLDTATVPRVGESVVSISTPLGVFQNSLSTGVVSGIRQGGLIQMTAPISHGSSGSPVFDQNGEAVGIAEAIAPAGENLNLALPIAAAMPLIDGSAHQTLSDVLTANEVSVPYLSRQIIVPARKQISFALKLNPNAMTYANLIGSFQSSGGAGGLAEMLVLHGGQIIWRSGRVQQQAVDVSLLPGAYTVMFSNGPSLVFSRNIVANLQLRYVQ